MKRDAVREEEKMGRDCLINKLLQVLALGKPLIKGDDCSLPICKVHHH